MKLLSVIMDWYLARSRNNDPNYVSEEWIAEQERAALRRGIDGPCWTWPVRRING